MSNIEKIRKKTQQIIDKKKNMRRGEYQHEYYLAHREQILESRRKKYQERKLENGSKIISSKISSSDI